MNHHAGTVCAVGAALLLRLGSTAWAASPPPPATLTWEAPDGCPTAGEVMNDVARTLAEPAAARTPVTATAQVLAGPGEVWQATLILDVGGTRTERRFQAESCQAIADAAALIIALAEEDAPDTAPIAAAPAAAPAPHTDAEMPPLLTFQPPPATKASRFFLMVNGLLDWDTMPSAPAGGLEAIIGGSRGTDRWRVGAVVGPEFFPSHRPAMAPYLGAVRGDFWMLGFTGRGCAAVAIDQVEIGPCAGAELVAMHATSDVDPTGDFASLANQTRFWFSFLGSLAVSWNVSPLWDVALRADVAVPTSRKVFTLDGNVLYDYVVSRGAVRGALGMAYRFQ